jgi:hypothetical protein
MHNLFASEDNNKENARNSVPFYVYPMAFTKDIGNIQSHGLMTHFNQCFTLINNVMHHHLPNDDEDENNSIAGDGPGPNGEDHPPHLGSSVLHGINCQVYNELSYRVQDEAKFHPVQLGMCNGWHRHQKKSPLGITGNIGWTSAILNFLTSASLTRFLAMTSCRRCNLKTHIPSMYGCLMTDKMEA